MSQHCLDTSAWSVVWNKIDILSLRKTAELARRLYGKMENGCVGGLKLQSLTIRVDLVMNHYRGSRLVQRSADKKVCCLLRQTTRTSCTSEVLQTIHRILNRIAPLSEIQQWVLGKLCTVVFHPNCNCKARSIKPPKITPLMPVPLCFYVSHTPTTTASCHYYPDSVVGMEMENLAATWASHSAS